MSSSFQGRINLSGGVISGIENKPGVITIANDSGEFSYNNAWAYSGFVDSHGHVLGLGIKLNLLSLDGLQSPDECVIAAQNHSFYLGEWLVGRGWNQELWNDRVFPDKSLLDTAFPEIPVYLVRVDGHSAWVNSKALEIASINENTIDPPGGAIIRNDCGEPTGILLDSAMDIVYKLIPRFSDEQVRNMVLDGVNELVSKGLTEVHDMDADPLAIELYKQLDINDLLPIKIHSYIKGQSFEWRKNGIKPFEGKKFSVTGVKFYADGALGSRGAALLAPYGDDPKTKGLLLLTFDELYERAKAALEDGFHVAVHAIGDAANRLVLNVYKKLFDDKVADKNSILRIEHAQIIHPDDLHILSEYPIIASVQPVHCTSDAKMARLRIGERCSYSYPWQTLLKRGVLILGGSDFPIESHDPLIGIDALVRRVPVDEQESWFPAERISREDAFKAYNFNPHIVENTLGKRGVIKNGMEGDLVILDKNLYECEEHKIGDAKVLAVFSNGKKVY